MSLSRMLKFGVGRNDSKLNADGNVVYLCVCSCCDQLIDLLTTLTGSQETEEARQFQVELGAKPKPGHFCLKLNDINLVKGYKRGYMMIESN